MTSTLGGDDPSHDLSPDQKDKEEKKLREEARKLLGSKHKKERTKKAGKYVVARASGGPDPRTVGSGRTGGTKAQCRSHFAPCSIQLRTVAI